ncbi:MAG: tagaturonate reductase [Clostridia bacterium]|nr:tagaturonate reductase [Clostridia bacterium]
MNKISYQTLREVGYDGYILENAPIRVLQFGEGNFLRAFVDYFFDLANERGAFCGKCALVQPIATGLTSLINEQEGLYTLYLRGSESGATVDKRRVISSVAKCLNPYELGDYDEILKIAASHDLEYIVSNTTEAGIVYDPACSLEDTPPASFPAKLTQVLLARYNAGGSGVVILSCELIDNNGDELRRCVNKYIELWGLDEDFAKYVNEKCTFATTLVDRIVPGRVRDAEQLKKIEDECGYTDALTDVGEVFGVWVIEGDDALREKLPFSRAGIDAVTVVPDVTPYKKRKVRILNGAHTGTVLAAYLGGFDIVRRCMKNPSVAGFMDKMLKEEILPILPKECEGSREFAEAVRDRFSNPFIDHALLDISLNSVSKWRARNMPSLVEYTEKYGKLPECLTFGFAALLAFYNSEVSELSHDGLHCRRPAGDEYVCRDDRWVLEFFYENRAMKPEELALAAAKNTAMWGRDLSLIPGFVELVTKYLDRIKKAGAVSAMASAIRNF